MEEFISKGYLYTEWKGKLTVKEGTVVRDDHCYAEEAKFRYGHRSREWVRCHKFPSILWGPSSGCLSAMTSWASGS